MTTFKATLVVKTNGSKDNMITWQLVTTDKRIYTKTAAKLFPFEQTQLLNVQSCSNMIKRSLNNLRSKNFRQLWHYNSDSKQWFSIKMEFPLTHFRPGSPEDGPIRGERAAGAEGPAAASPSWSSRATGLTSSYLAPAHGARSQEEAGVSLQQQQMVQPSSSEREEELFWRSSSWDAMNTTPVSSLDNPRLTADRDTGTTAEQLLSP